MDTSRVVDVIRRRWKQGAVVLVVLMLLVTGGVLWYLTHPLGAREGSVASVRADPGVVVEPSTGGYVMHPPGGETTSGLVFYPGGLVAPESYLRTLAPLVREENVTVVVPAMPLNLAVLDPGRARNAMLNHPDVERWAVGGHSLGGAMACRYAGNHRERVEGLVLFAAYCDRDVSGSGLAVLSVTGSDDVVLNRGTYRRNLRYLPADARVVEIEGMNHSQFGDYTGQRGGRPATLSYEGAHERLAGVLVEWYGNRTRGESRGTAGD